MCLPEGGEGGEGEEAFSFFEPVKCFLRKKISIRRRQTLVSKTGRSETGAVQLTQRTALASNSLRNSQVREIISRSLSGQLVESIYETQ